MKTPTREYWDVVWSRPYINYEKHHQVFWAIIQAGVKGKTLDLAIGSGSYYRSVDPSSIELYGCDYSPQALVEAKKNFPSGNYHCEEIPNHHYDSMQFDTVVVCGLVNYIENLEPLVEMIKRVTHKDSRIFITINVIDDFEGRHWDCDRIETEFLRLGVLRPQFYPLIGWLIDIIRV